jgi:hypothetical protein
MFLLKKSSKFTKIKNNNVFLDFIRIFIDIIANNLKINQ